MTTANTRPDRVGCLVSAVYLLVSLSKTPYPLPLNDMQVFQLVTLDRSDRQNNEIVDCIQR